MSAAAGAAGYLYRNNRIRAASNRVDEQVGPDVRQVMEVSGVSEEQAEAFMRAREPRIEYKRRRSW